MPFNNNALATLENPLTENLFYQNAEELANAIQPAEALSTENYYIITTENGVWLTTEGNS